MESIDFKVITIPDAAVEAVATVLYDKELFALPFRDARAHLRDHYLSRARALLEVAAPHLTDEPREAWEDGVIHGHISEGRLLDKREANPYGRGK